MKADHPSPTAPPAPAADTPPTPLGTPHSHHEEPNALQLWLQSTWAKLKSGRLGGNPKWFALAIGVALVLGAWWYLSRANKKADSALWRLFDASETTSAMEEFANLPANAKTGAGAITRVNVQRNKVHDGLMGLTAGKLADRLKAAKTLEEARDEVVKLADEFGRDRTMKAMSLLVGAEAEKALIGVPKEGVSSSAAQFEPKANSRGQVERYAELKRKAAEAVGANTAAGQKHTADADRYTAAAKDIYEACAKLNATFNEPDPEERKTDTPLPPLGGIPDPAKPEEKKSDEKPLTPVEPKVDDKKPEEKKPEEKPLKPVEPPAEKK